MPVYWLYFLSHENKGHAVLQVSDIACQNVGCVAMLSKCLTQIQTAYNFLSEKVFVVTSLYLCLCKYVSVCGMTNVLIYVYICVQMSVCFSVCW